MVVLRVITQAPEGPAAAFYIPPEVEVQCHIAQPDADGWWCWAPPPAVLEGQAVASPHTPEVWVQCTAGEYFMELCRILGLTAVFSPMLCWGC